MPDTMAYDAATPSSVRVAVYRNGYLPVPVSAPWVKCKHPGKQPLMGDWRQVCAAATENEIRAWGTDPKCTNTGILTNTCRAIDIDVYDEELASKLLDLAFQHFGPTPLLRTGRAPKVLGVWAAVDDFPKVTTKAYLLPQGGTAKVEILANGQQFVAFGDHPDTGKPYRWHGASPIDIPICDLEAISHDAAIAYRDCADAMIVHAGGILVKPKTEAMPLNAVPLLPSDIADGWAAAALNREYDNVRAARRLLGKQRQGRTFQELSRTSDRFKGCQSGGRRTPANFTSR